MTRWHIQSATMYTPEREAGCLKEDVDKRKTWGRHSPPTIIASNGTSLFNLGVEYMHSSEYNLTASIYQQDRVPARGIFAHLARVKNPCALTPPPSVCHSDGQLGTCVVHSNCGAVVASAPPAELDPKGFHATFASALHSAPVPQAYFIYDEPLRHIPPRRQEGYGWWRSW